MDFFALSGLYLVLGVASIVCMVRMSRLVIIAINRIFRYLEDKLP